MRTTIRDVAREAGVSIATVSRVMRGSASVTEPTRERVLAVAQELEFVPSQLGRQLAERRHAANGIVFPDLSGPYYAEVVLGYEAVAAELGRSVLILSTHGRQDADAKVLEMAERCDGLVILGRTVGDTTVERLAKRGVGLVLVARPAIATADSVNVENRDSAVALAEHLVARGARDFVFVGDPDGSSEFAERLEGVEEGFRRAGSRRRSLALAARPTEEAGAAVADSVGGVDDLPDAFVCANDELALGLMARLGERGIDVPGDVLVTGWDDVMAARYAGLTTVRQPMRELGGTAARLLDELINGSRSEPRHEVLGTELVVRGSTLGKEHA
ncbi:LacI family DNA-binding transcriptional regulator [Nocardioides sp. SYSU D00038]|uniref:LacI family DNA-binding transcriptional regulator n=1 Tax=Nocardioides sp. SYSU D00038 TaxID=2812554 RepID=UPI0019674CF6|nr:LacI family DNA-binding transcriptional regulator [Nocardioides sp. SYSU D00038]